MRITNLKCAVIGDSPVVRIVTDEGYERLRRGRVLQALPQAARTVLQAIHPGRGSAACRAAHAQHPPPGVVQTLGSAVSAIEIALWDVARPPAYPCSASSVAGSGDRVRVYNSAVRFPMTGYSPKDYADDMARMKAFQRGHRRSKRTFSDGRRHAHDRVG